MPWRPREAMTMRSQPFDPAVSIEDEHPCDQGRVAGDDEQRGEARQRRDDVLGDAISQEFLLRVA